MKFSVPANRSWNVDVEIIVKLVWDNGSVITEPTPVDMTTVLAANWPTVTVTDTYPGMVCGVSYRSPGSPYERYYWVLQVCDETTRSNSTPHGIVSIVTNSNGEASFHRMLHTHATENGNRTLVFSATVNGVTKSLASNPIEVTRKQTDCFVLSRLHLTIILLRTCLGNDLCRTMPCTYHCLKITSSSSSY